MQMKAPNSPQGWSQPVISHNSKPENRKAYQVVAQTTFGTTKTFIHAANHRQAAAISKKMLKGSNPEIKSVTLAPNA